MDAVLYSCFQVYSPFDWYVCAVGNDFGHCIRVLKAFQSAKPKSYELCTRPWNFNCLFYLTHTLGPVPGPLKKYFTRLGHPTQHPHP